MNSKTISPHIPVLIKEVLNNFNSISMNGYFIDATVGYAGHSMEILLKYPELEYIGIDKDKTALEFSKKNLFKLKHNKIYYHKSFSDIFTNFDFDNNNVSAILADFGVSSLQLDQDERGFSYNSKFLDMRMNRDKSLSAYEVINHYKKIELENILNKYGEVSNYKQVATEIIKRRSKKPIETARELAEIVERLTSKQKRIHPATLVFQAIRIEVNDELKDIENFLKNIEEKARENRLKGVVISLISFHSLEDRLVKNYFRNWTKKCICDNSVMRCECGQNNKLGKLLNKKPIIASKDEIKVNPRARSAKLRTFIFSE